MEQRQQSTYLSLSAASQLLGVHGTTLRRWADAGAVPVYVTPGGHRRFARADIEALIAQGSVGGSQQSLAYNWAQRVVTQTRDRLERDEQMPSWLTSLEEEERDAWRRVSQQLMGVVLRYVSSQEDDEALLEQARTIGRDYATKALRVGMPLTVALEAALFFRDSLVAAAMDLPEPATLHGEASTRLLHRISQVLNAVQLAVVAGYEADAVHRSH